MKSPHMTALAVIGALAILAAILITLMAAVAPLDLAVSLGALSDVLLTIGIVSALLAIALAGVRHLLAQLPSDRLTHAPNAGAAGALDDAAQPL